MWIFSGVHDYQFFTRFWCLKNWSPKNHWILANINRFWRISGGVLNLDTGRSWASWSSWVLRYLLPCKVGLRGSMRWEFLLILLMNIKSKCNSKHILYQNLLLQTPEKQSMHKQLRYKQDSRSLFCQTYRFFLGDVCVLHVHERFTGPWQILNFLPSAFVTFAGTRGGRRRRNYWGRAWPKGAHWIRYARI